MLHFCGRPPSVVGAVHGFSSFCLLLWAAAAGALMCGKCCGVMVVLAVHHVAIMDGHALLGAGGGMLPYHLLSV